MKYNITLGYRSKLSILETIEGIEEIRTSIFSSLKNKYNLITLNPGMITNKNIWLNDDFQFVERPIEFDSSSHLYGEIIMSNNKWRRYFMYKMELKDVDKGIICDFNSVRRDAELSSMNSLVYSEIGIELFSEKTNMDEINKKCVDLYEIIVETDKKISEKSEILSKNHFSGTLIFISYKKLKMLYPFLSFGERLDRFARENGSFVLTDFVEKLLGQKDKTPYSEDVFNFKYLAKIYYYNRIIEKSMSIGYVGYQVDKNTLKEQNLILKENWKTNTEYNYLIKADELPLTISAGININRVIMAILEKYHIGEVHSSIWDEDFLEYCKKNGIEIL